MSSNTFYVYQVTLGENIIYVGKGKGDRHLHAVSGKSHNALLNEYFFRHKLLGEPLPIVEIIGYFSEEDQALSIEEDMIKKHSPVCNKTHNQNPITVCEEDNDSRKAGIIGTVLGEYLDILSHPNVGYVCFKEDGMVTLDKEWYNTYSKRNPKGGFIGVLEEVEKRPIYNKDGEYYVKLSDIQ